MTRPWRSLFLASSISSMISGSVVAPLSTAPLAGAVKVNTVSENAPPALSAGPGTKPSIPSGIRGGDDVFKALALGADAVMVGRLQAHALAVAGAEKILRREVNPQAHAQLLAELRKEI